MSCVGSNKADIQVGVDVSLAGLIFQVITLTVFCALFADYLILCERSRNRKAFTKRLNFFLIALSFSTFLILLRCVYRIVELQDGYFSHWFRDESLLIALESG